MPAQSQQQQKLFGLALAFKRGEVPSSEVSDEIKAIADRMSEKEIEDFASTKHKGLPKMKEQLRKIVREIMRERAISEMNEVSINEDENPCWNGYEMVGMKMKDGKEVPNCVPKNESVNEGKKSKDSTGIRKVVAIYTNVDAIIELVFDDKKDAKEVVGTMGPVLVNAINATLKHKFKPTAGNEDKLKQFKSKLKELLKLVEALIKKPSKAGIKRLETMHRNWWNHSFGADIAFNGKYADSIIESVNEAASKEAMGIAALTGTRSSAVEEFINKHELDGGKLFRSIKKANLQGRLNFVSALAGKDGNPNQKLTIKLHKKNESVTEGASAEEKKIVMMAIKKIAKYRNVPLNVALIDTIRAAEELERTIKK